MERAILLPLDGSPLAETALPHAVTLARMTSSGLVLLRAVSQPNVLEPIAGMLAPSSSTWDVWEAQVSVARDYLAGVVERLQVENLEIEEVLPEDHPAESIVQYCIQNPNVEMIVMATHGLGGLRHWVFGSVAEKVLHVAPRPLLLIRPPRTDTASEEATTPAKPVYHTILVPLDGSEFAEQALVQAKNLALASGARIVLVSAVRIPDYMSELAGTVGPVWVESSGEPETKQLTAYLADQIEQLEKAGLRATAHVIMGLPEEEILNVGKREHADLVVMSTHGRSGLQRLWLGSVAVKVVQSAAMPVLLVRIHE